MEPPAQQIERTRKMQNGKGFEIADSACGVQVGGAKMMSLHDDISHFFWEAAQGPAAPIQTMKGTTQPQGRFLAQFLPLEYPK